MDEFSKLFEDFNRNGANYHFFQAVYWLEKLLVNNNPRKKIVFAPAAELSFPASDIRRINFDQDDIKLQLNFMGFYGVDSPLPQYFFANLATEDEAKNQIKQFLNIFNQRIYQLFFTAWKKYRIHIQAEERQCNYLNHLIALSGNSLNHADTDELAFAGLMGSRNHSALSLKYLLQEFLKIPAIYIQDFIPTRVKLVQQWLLGSNNILANNILLGNEIVDLTNKIRVTVGPITSAELEDFLPIKSQGRKLGLLIKRYLNPLIDFEIIVKFTSKNYLKLGENIFYLGWTSALGAEETTVYHVTFNHQGYTSFGEQLMPAG